MVDLPTNWVDNTGMIEDAAFLNLLGGKVNTLTHAAPAAGVYSSRPSAGNAGALYFSQDNDTLYRDNGSSWDKIRIGGDSCDAMGDVPSSGWTAVNMQSGASFSADKDAMLFTVPSTGSADTWQYQYRSYPTPPFTLTAEIETLFKANTITANTQAAFGLLVDDGTKLIEFGAKWVNLSSLSTPWLANGWSVGGWKWNSTTAYNGAYSNFWPLNFIGAKPKWFRLTDDATNLIWQYSLNGIDWATVITEARTAFLTPSRIGLAATNYTGNAAVIRVRSWNGVA